MIFTDRLVNDGREHPSSATRTGRSSTGRSSDCGAQRLESSPDIRAGMAMLHRGALRRRPDSEIGNIRQIDRGYERIDERLRELGARIERVATEPVPAAA